MHYSSLHDYQCAAFYIWCIIFTHFYIVLCSKNKSSPGNAVCCTFSNSSKGLVTHQIPSTHTLPLFLKQEINSLSCHRSQNLQFSGEVVACREEHLRNRALCSPHRSPSPFAMAVVLCQFLSFWSKAHFVCSPFYWSNHVGLFVAAQTEEQIKASKNGGKLPTQTELWMNILGAQLASEADWDNKSGRESNVSPCQPLHNSIKKTTYSLLFIFLCLPFMAQNMFSTKTWGKLLKKNLPLLSGWSSLHMNMKAPR